jgi:hypothetical protein
VVVEKLDIRNCDSDHPDIDVFDYSAVDEEQPHRER